MNECTILIHGVARTKCYNRLDFSLFSLLRVSEIVCVDLYNLIDIFQSVHLS